MSQTRYKTGKNANLPDYTVGLPVVDPNAPTAEKVRAIDAMVAANISIVAACEHVGLPRISYYKFKERTTPDQQGDAA